MIQWIRRTAAAGTAVLLSIYGAAAYYAWQLPDSYYIPTDGTLQVDTVLHISAAPSDHTAVQAVTDSDSGTETASLQLFGIVPIKDVEVQEIDRPMLVPCGQAFGIKLRMEGAMIVGMDSVETTSGDRCPAQEAGLQTGDLIQKIDGQAVDSNESLQDAIAASKGDTVTVTYVRGEETCTCALSPAFAVDDNRYEAGVWVRDSSAGIGTITFYDPETGSFGGLGHPICDTDTGDILPLGSGDAVAATISQVIRGTSGSPGMLQGSFKDEAPMGELLCNNRCGVFGTLYENPSEEEAIPMAFKQEIQTGEAQILCTIDGDTPKAYDVVLEEIDYSGTDSTKNMTIRVTDPELLERTGGIVQGMSGSPIIQNGMLVGAVTHVFVDDPTCGYGIFCENMVRYGLCGS
ncbi:MAG: SpoIVB peptidase [Ruminococcus sp.]